MSKFKIVSVVVVTLWISGCGSSQNQNKKKTNLSDQSQTASAPAVAEKKDDNANATPVEEIDRARETVINQPQVDSKKNTNEKKGVPSSKEETKVTQTKNKIEVKKEEEKKSDVLGEDCPDFSGKYIERMLIQKPLSEKELEPEFSGQQMPGSIEIVQETCDGLVIKRDQSETQLKVSSECVVDENKKCSFIYYSFNELPILKNEEGQKMFFDTKSQLFKETALDTDLNELSIKNTIPSSLVRRTYSVKAESGETLSLIDLLEDRVSFEGYKNESWNKQLNGMISAVDGEGNEEEVSGIEYSIMSEDAQFRTFQWIKQ
ncbi:MAG: hypothetical protein CL678_03570 [Bdellovibrionaceae bacterium]|nr:hypothetical protein [Pseudobdellovibrionaceae bacterium]|tara:strand:- start:8488 stop:9441 length:954 start_codon:yes stop_codon:yes gene_type:complete